MYYNVIFEEFAVGPLWDPQWDNWHPHARSKWPCLLYNTWRTINAKYDNIMSMLCISTSYGWCYVCEITPWTSWTYPAAPWYSLPVLKCALFLRGQHKVVLKDFVLNGIDYCRHVLSTNPAILSRKWLQFLLFCRLELQDHIQHIIWTLQYRLTETPASMTSWHPYFLSAFYFHGQVSCWALCFYLIVKFWKGTGWHLMSCTLTLI